MDRHAAHWDWHPHVLAPTGEGDVEDLGSLLGIIEEQLEEIAHAVEQQAIPGFCLQRQVLRHHRGCGSAHRIGLAG